MVFFTCNNCGDSVKKPSVLKHYAGMCRKPINLTCIDCCKDFDGATFDQHTRCITEEEKYSAKGFVAKPPSNKQEIKQQNWTKLIQSVAESDKVSSKDELNLLQFLSRVSNVPRKKVKFMNFVCNCAKKFHSSTAENVWQLLDREQNAVKSSNSNNNDKNGAVTEDSDQSPTKSPKKEIVAVSPPSDETVNSTSVSDSAADQKLLSKKEKKALKKKLKYESEIKDIENKDPKSASEIDNETNVEEKNKNKKRKQRTSEGESESEVVTTNEDKGKTLSKKQLKAVKRAKLNSISESAISNGDGASVEGGIETKDKKKKKKKDKEAQMVLKAPPVEDSTAVEPQEEEVPVENTKFDWETVIVEVLSGRKDKQLSLKRLRKKVVAEYVARKNGGHVPDNILAKFNKKVQKIPNVKVINDVAMLKVQ